MTQYLTVAQFKLYSTMRTEFIDELEISQPGFIDAQLDLFSNWIDARLRKRYAAPFGSPVPTAVLGWLAAIATIPVWLKRGVDPDDKQWDIAKQDAQRARDEVKEAAESTEALFDLPLRQDTTASGLKNPKTRVYSEQSPYSFQDTQAQTGHEEDDQRSGGFSA